MTDEMEVKRLHVVVWVKDYKAYRVFPAFSLREARLKAHELFLSDEFLPEMGDEVSVFDLGEADGKDLLEPIDLDEWRDEKEGLIQAGHYLPIQYPDEIEWSETLESDREGVTGGSICSSEETCYVREGEKLKTVEVPEDDETKPVVAAPKETPRVCGHCGVSYGSESEPRHHPFCVSNKAPQGGRSIEVSRNDDGDTAC